MEHRLRCDVGVIGVGGRGFLEFAELGHGDVNVLFEIGEIEVFAGEVQDDSEGRYRGVRKRAVEIADDVCAATVA